MKLLIGASIALSTLMLLASNPVEASQKRGKVIETRNAPALAWTCKTNLSGNRSTILKGYFSESRTIAKSRNNSPQSARVSAIDVQTDEFGLLSGSGLMAISDVAFSDDKQFRYSVSSKAKDDDGLLTLKFDFLPDTNSGSVVILLWNKLGHSVEGTGLCTVKLEDKEPK